MLILQIFGIFAVILLGFLITDMLIPDESIFERILLGFPLGIGIFTFVMFIVNWKFGAKLTLFSSSAILLALILVFFSINSISKIKYNKNIFDYNFKKQSVDPTFSKIEIVLVATILFVLLSNLAYNLYWPVKGWDALTLYDFRAKLILGTGNITSILIDPYYITYPLNTSLSHFWTYLLGLQSPMIIYSLYYFSLLACFYLVLRKFCSRMVSLLFLFLLSINTLLFQHSILAYTNLPYTVYFVLGVVYLYSFYLQKRLNIQNLVLSATLIGLSTWTRYTEPFWLLPIVVVCFLSAYYKKYLYGVIYALVTYIFRYPWFIFLKSGRYEISSVESTAGSFVNKIISGMNINNFIEVAKYILSYSITGNLLLWIAFLFSILLIYRENKKDRPNQMIPLFFTYGIVLMMFVGSYLYYLTGAYQNWIQQGDSIGRISMIFVPLLLFFTGINFEYFLGRNKLHG